MSTTNADCILLLFLDPVTKTIANVHSGWKGTLQRISVKTVDKMINQYFYEITKNEEMVFGNISNSGDTSEMDKRLKDIDTTFYSKLCSVIYNLNVIHGEIDIQNEEQYDKSKKPEGDKEK